MKEKIALVVQGGAMRSVYTAGVLDAFIAAEFNPFDLFIGVSSGSMCLSYYISEQYKFPYSIVRSLARDENFINFKHLFAAEGYLNLSYLEQFSRTHFPLDLTYGMQMLADKTLEIVATNLTNGNPVYLEPTAENWEKCIRASSTLPFVTRGVCKINGMELMDGGWSDPIPVKRAIELGAKKIVVIRTLPKMHKLDWSYMNLFGGYYHRKNPSLSKRFENDHIQYNEIVDFLADPPQHVEILQIAPQNLIQTSNYSTTEEKLLADYRHGMADGVNFLYETARQL